MVSFLCGARDHKGENEKKKSVQLGGKKPVINSKAHLIVAKLTCWRKLQDVDENALWKRTIIRGEKCRPLEFSGKICYDAKGNPVLD
ncbi:hypothetical protein RND71_014194 [Anisodus tanguticus]|uniref:Uncharacterized protein n=1 Tax=Anisodus tanguticus TaxID=243964 RepID=A0AAE1S8N6_9SOLA|nr:hypothetical protein RND71_014194 [Anisodus tanguticus]